ncbi:portal protein [Microbacterium phage PauloDiaboli]|nr:portal protein [Microbacterium phage PauloDiaboli]QWY83932.1 portal protein [Microbacterium phage A3Wally]
MANPFRRESNSSSPEPVAYNAMRPMTAAAARVNLKDKTEAELFRAKQGSQMVAIQNAAWEYYDAISEVKYAFTLVASVVSRIRLYVAVVENPAEQPVPLDQSEKIDPELADAARRMLERLDSAFGGQAGLLRDAALNLAVAGECYLVQVPERPGQGLPETWDIRSVDELKVDKQGNYAIYPRRDIKPGNGGGALPKGAIPLPPDAFMGRIWRPHPRFSEDPDTSMIGLLALCEELLLLDRTFRGSHRSRLNAGIFFVPDGMSTAGSADPDLFADEDDEDQPTPEDAADAFQEELLLAMSTPIEDETSAASVVPLLIRGPVDLGKELKHITFSRPFDDAMVARADRVLDRILQGLDVPKDTITGLANVKYNNAVQIDESLYKAHIEPMLLLLADAFTAMYLRPALIRDGWTQADVKKVTVWYDASAVATRNDRAMDADNGYDRFAISGDTWRRAHGFADQDAPTGKEIILRMLVEKGGIDPTLSEALLRVLAPDVIDAARGANQATSVAPIPGQVNDILNGGQGAPAADPNAPIDVSQPDNAPPTDPMQPTVGDVMPEPEAPVAPGDDAPPFPLAEPGD